MRVIVARCEVEYSGRLSALLPEALRLLMLKADGSVLVHADAGGYKPLNWMTPPTCVEESDGRIVVRKLKGDDALDIRISEVLSDVTYDMGSPDAAAGLVKDGVERDLQELLADRPEWCGEGFRLVRREWPTDIGPGRPHVPRRGRRVDRRRDQARRDDRRRRAAPPLPRADPGSTRRWATAAGCSRRRCSSPRRGCSPRRAGSPAWRSTSPCCAASASRT
jgi:hypothetical protein